MCWTAHADLAAAAAAVLLEEGRFEEPTPPLTAGEALDLDDIAPILGDLCGKPIRRRVVSDEQLAAELAARQVPPVVIAITLGMCRAARAGAFAAVDPTLANPARPRADPAARRAGRRRRRLMHPGPTGL